VTLPKQPKFTPAELADLSALADGSLAPERRAAVQARIDADPQLRELFERELQAARILARARARDRAGPALREAIETLRGSQAPDRRVRRTRGWAAGVGVAVAAAVALLAVVLTGSQAPASPSVPQAVALALRGSSLPAPAPDPSSPRTQLAAAVGTLHFPNYRWGLNTNAVGQRSDQLASRRAVTVYYSRGEQRLAYTIVSGPPLRWPKGQATMPGFVALRVGGRTVVTWRRDGHTCVISATGVPLHELLAIASWTPTVPAGYTI
jgi:anti-sigma factor RsiW